MIVEKYDEIIYKKPSEVEENDVLGTWEIVEEVGSYGDTIHITTTTLDGDINWDMELENNILVEVIGKVIE